MSESSPLGATHPVVVAAERKLRLAHIDAERKTLLRPWWQSGPTITAIAAILAATVPITTAVIQSYSNARQREYDERKTLAERAQSVAKDAAEQEIARLRLSNEQSAHYLQLASDEKQLKRVLRFVKETSLDEKLAAWAKNEIDRLDAIQTADEQRAAAQEALSPQKADKTESAKLGRRIVAEASHIRRIESAKIESDPDKLRIQVYTTTIQVVGRLMNADAPGQASPDLARFWQLYWGDMIAVEDRAVESAMVKFGELLKQCAAQCDGAALKGAGQTVILDMKRHEESVAAAHVAAK
jgi:hypothetical protein